ncbi:MAG: HAD-IIB family hydrolase [Verrucomicrobiota bacterium]
MILATDLDRTLFPNGMQPADASMPLLKQLVIKHAIEVIYVTGRHIKQIQQGIEEYNPPLPTFAITDVGTRIYKYQSGTFSEDEGYVGRIKNLSPGWDFEMFKKKLSTISHLQLQPEDRQNQFKLSYFVDDLKAATETIARVRRQLNECCSCFDITYSVDETAQQGLLDVLPSRANKMEGIEYLREKEGIALDDILYAGDSGNDISALTHGYKAVLVANAIDEVRQETIRIAQENKTLEQVYFAKGDDALKLNGCYHSGIIEALFHFHIIT